MAPLISVVMPTYNCKRFLRDAIESILNQTFQDFEFLIIDDDSTDGTETILRDYSKKDSRLRVYRHEREGLIASLNRGCHLAEGRFIARMDSDDISLPHRLEHQVRYMEEHPEIGVLGTWIRIIDESSRPRRTVRLITDPKMLGLYLYMENCICHPTVMMRRDIIEPLGFYDSNAIHAEDYDLWGRVSHKNQIANLPEVLLDYRIWNGGVTSNNLEMRNQIDIAIRQTMITKLLGHNIPIRSIVTPLDIANSSLIDMILKTGKTVGFMRQLFPAYARANSLNRIESLKTETIALLFFKSIIKKMLIAKAPSAFIKIGNFRL